MLRRLNDALPGLVLGIIVYGAAVFLAGIWFVPDKLRFTTGLAIGIALACGMAVNMAVVLRDAVEIYGEAKARSKIIARSVTRYLVVGIFRDDEVGAWQSAGSIYWCFGIEDISVSAAPCT
ncbi:MAG: hypothetical protein E6386_16260 [Roseburia hominis]|uniref:hypothetical protein n=1 Tax=Roseburia hominis TaxID=301301 RepID=UPI00290ACCE8|nr:hypothetical protein [Roseburia hominis]MDU6922751.1 hypothetical protein [Roseburia hominis]